MDVILCPIAPHPVPEIKRYNAAGYILSWVFLDCPAGMISVKEFAGADLELGTA